MGRCLASAEALRTLAVPRSKQAGVIGEQRGYGTGRLMSTVRMEAGGCVRRDAA